MALISTSRNKIEIIKGTVNEKYQLMSKIFVTKKYENTRENIKEGIIIGMNNSKEFKNY